jgi:hypothetical protein
MRKQEIEERIPKLLRRLLPKPLLTVGSVLVEQQGKANSLKKDYWKTREYF